MINSAVDKALTQVNARDSGDSLTNTIVGFLPAKLGRMASFYPVALGVIAERSSF